MFQLQSCILVYSCVHVTHQKMIVPCLCRRFEAACVNDISITVFFVGLCEAFCHVYCQRGNNTVYQAVYFYLLGVKKTVLMFTFCNGLLT